MFVEQVFIISGAPSSGKGTVCQALKDKGDVEVISTSQSLLEAGIALNFVQKGLLAPDEVIFALLKKKLVGLRKPVAIIDTLCSVRQCEMFAGFLNSLDQHVRVITIHLEVFEENAISRMKEKGQPDDGNAEARVVQYFGSSEVVGYGKPVLNKLLTIGPVEHVNANRQMLEVIDSVRRILDFYAEYNDPSLIIPPAARPNNPYKTT